MTLGLGACGGGGGGSTPSSPPVTVNLAPTANAGLDQQVFERVTLRLNGAGSSDTDGTIASFAWQQTAGPSAPLNSASIALPTLTVPEVNADTVLTFELTVTDNDGATNTDTVTLTAQPDPIDDAPTVPLTFNGKNRVYTLYTPSTYQPGNPAFLVLHGGSGSMRSILRPDRSTRRWVDLADRDGTLLIVPNGFDNGDDNGLGDSQSWNDIRNDLSGGTSLQDDAGFLLAVLDDASARAAYDTDTVYIAGSSNGGIMTMTMLIQHPDRFAAGAAFIAALPEEAVPDPASPTPLMMQNGTEDPLILIDGGVVGQNGSPTRSVADTIDYWVRNTGADPASAAFSSLPDTVADDDCVITRTAYTETPGEAPVFVYYEAVGGGHSITDPTPPIFSQAVLNLIGNQCREAHGVDLAVEFFQALD